MAAASRMILESAERASTSSRAGAMLAICLSAVSRCQSVLTSFDSSSRCPRSRGGLLKKRGAKEGRGLVVVL